ncbi:MAG: hypothetical protein ACR2OY_04550 [Boseongicola sp.]
MDYLPKPVLLIDRDRRLLCSNRRGRQLIDQQHYLRVSTNKQLHLLDKHADHRLDEIVAQEFAGATATKAPRVVRFQCTQRLEHSLKLQPMHGTDSAGEEAFPRLARYCCLVSIQLSDSCINIQPAIVSELFGLTPAAARLVAALAAGQSLINYCESAGIKMATGRWHLHHALQKTNCTNQPELVARVLHSLL